MQHIDSLVVAVSFHSKDEGVLIVGRQNKRNQMDVINAFSGKDAHELYTKLITKNINDKGE